MWLEGKRCFRCLDRLRTDYSIGRIALKISSQEGHERRERLVFIFGICSGQKISLAEHARVKVDCGRTYLLRARRSATLYC
jgi:hypothetical protein